MFALPDVVSKYVGHAMTTDIQNDGQYWFFPKEVRQAVLDGNTAIVHDAKRKHANDVKANIDIIAKEGARAWVTDINKSNDETYHICETSTGVMWTHTIKIEHVNAKIRSTVAVGTFSKNTNIIGISASTFNNLPSNIAAFIISGIAAQAVATFVAESIGGAIYAASATAAEAVFAAGLETAGVAAVVVGELLVTITSVVAGLVAFVIVGLLVYFTISAIVQSFGLEVNIYNWSREEGWEASELYTDNALIDPGFKSVMLPPVTNPFSNDPVLETNDLAASYASWTFTNNNKFAEGLGIGIKFISKLDLDHSLYLKYIVHWGSDNELNIEFGPTGNGLGSLEEFYKRPGIRSNVIKAQREAVGRLGRTTAIALTPALSGEESHLYCVDLHIHAQVVPA